MPTNDLIYFVDGKVVAEAGSAKVYKMAGELFLEIGPGHTLWALESEIIDYMEQLEDYPRGDCLEIGLGLGVVSRYLLTFPNVKHLTTVEINNDVISAHSKILDEDRGVRFPYDNKKHLILCADGVEYAYLTKRRYDFIFIDCYDRIDEETLPIITDMYRACSRILKPNGKIMAWLDRYTPPKYYDEFRRILSGR